MERYEIVTETAIEDEIGGIDCLESQRSVLRKETKVWDYKLPAGPESMNLLHGKV